MLAPVITLERVTLRRGAKTVLRDVSLGASPGEFVALCGPNGAGKSSLLGVMAGDLQPTSGEAALWGAPIRTYKSMALARRRAVLEQTPGLSAGFTVSELVTLGAEVAPLDATPSVSGIVETALERATMSGFANRAVLQLSGGEQARAHFARVLAQLAAGRFDQSGEGGSALLLDEPTASLDLAHQAHVLKAAKALTAEGVAVIAVLHDLNLAAAFADRIAVMAEGSVTAIGPPEAVLTPETIGAAYSAAVDVDTGPEGHVRVTPLLGSVQ